MKKKDWVDRKNSVEKLLKVAQFNEKKAQEDQEELEFMISNFDEKIKTFK